MRHKIRFTTVIIFGALIIFVGLATYAVTAAHAQSEFADQLFSSLDSQGVPVISVKITSRVPFAVDIAIQSESTDDQIDAADVDYISLARRAVILSYRSGPHLDSARVYLLNESGDEIEGGEYFMTPDTPNQQLSVPATPELSNQALEGVIYKQFELDGLPGVKVEQLAVTTMDTPGGQGQRLDLVIRELDDPEMLASTEKIYDAFADLLNVRRKPTTSLIYGHLQILTPDGKVDLDVTRDVEVQGEKMLSQGGNLTWLRKIISIPPGFEDLTPTPVKPYP